MKFKKLILTFLLTISLSNLFSQKLIELDEDKVFDKAEYLIETMLYDGLSQDQAYVHIGLFFAWIINNSLTSEQFNSENDEDINSHKNREISPCQIFKNLDGELLGKQFNKLGYNFISTYYDKYYLSDYQIGLKLNDNDLYIAKDSWENYDLLKKVLDIRLEKWKSQLGLEKFHP